MVTGVEGIIEQYHPEETLLTKAGGRGQQCFQGVILLYISRYTSHHLFYYTSYKLYHMLYNVVNFVRTGRNHNYNKLVFLSLMPVSLMASNQS